MGMSIFKRFNTGLYFLCFSNNPIEYVDSFKHLGHVIMNQLTDNADILKRRSDFVWTSNNFLCFFSKLSSLIKYSYYFTHIVWACMAVSSGYLVMTRSTTCVCHGRKVCAEYWACRLILIVICSRCRVSVCLYLMGFVHSLKFNSKVCICNGSLLVRAVSNYGIQYGWHNSLLGHSFQFSYRLSTANPNRKILHVYYNNINNIYILSQIDVVTRGNNYSASTSSELHGAI